MEPHLDLAARQLARMRGMNAAYHRRFFSDVRFHLLVMIGILALGVWLHPGFHLLVAPVALVGACQTAFDASYLIFSRQYATRLEQLLNAETGHDVLVAHRLEDVYLFPLDRTKVVTLAPGAGFTWFGFMTFLYTALGATLYLAGLGLSLRVLDRAGSVVVAGGYLAVLAALTLLALGVGWWWFVGGEGERRLRRVLDEAFKEGAA